VLRQSINYGPCSDISYYLLNYCYIGVLIMDFECYIEIIITDSIVLYHER